MKEKEIRRQEDEYIYRYNGRCRKERDEGSDRYSIRCLR